MKKIAILILSILIAGLFVACNQDITVDAQTYANMEVGTFVLNGQNYATLQAAVDAIGSKAAGDNVIRLTKNASGPGAKIANKEVTIDFQGYTYSFTNVNGLQGQDVAGKDFGLSITSGSDVVLKGMEKIDLNDKSTTDLTMVYVEGKETKLAIESAPKMVVEPDQYVFWAADGATLTIGSTNVSDEASITGKVAATGGASEDSKPTVTVQGATTLAGGVKAESAKVTLAGESKVTGTIEASGTTNVAVSESSKIEASVKATDTTTVVISSTEKSTITSLDKEETTTVVIDSAVDIDEFADGSNKEIVETDDADIGGDAADEVKEPETTVYVAMYKDVLYETLAEAIDAVEDDEPESLEDIPVIKLLADVAEETINSEKVFICNLNNKTVGTSASVAITNNGVMIITGTGIVNFGSYSGAGELYLAGGTYNLDISVILPEGISIAPWCMADTDKHTVRAITEADNPVAQVGDYYFFDLGDAIDFAESGETVTLLANIELAGPEIIDATTEIVLDLAGKTVTAANEFTIPSGCPQGLFVIYNGGSLTVKDSSEQGTGSISSDVDTIYGGIILTRTGEEYYDETKTATLVVNGGTISGYYYGISGNGRRNNTSVTINGGTVKSGSASDGLGIYNPQNGTVEINGGIVRGCTGIYAKAGSVTINGGTIIATGTAAEYKYNGSGGEPTGDAVMIDSCAYPGGTPSLTITGNPTFTVQENAHAIAVYHVSTTGTADGTHVPSASVVDKDYTGTEKVHEVYGYWDNTKKEFVLWTALNETHMKGYTGLQAAITNAVEKDVVVLLQDINLTSTVDISKSLTFDGRGNTLTTVTGGDSSSKSIKLSADNIEVTIKNLTTIEKNDNYYGRGLQLENSGINLTIDNCTISALHYAINFWANGDEGANNCIVHIIDSEINGWGALNIWSHGLELHALRSTFDGINDKVYNSDGWNGFGTIVLEGDTTKETTNHAENCVLNFDECTIISVATTGNSQSPVLYNLQSVNNKVEFTNCSFSWHEPNVFCTNNGTGNTLFIDGSEVLIGLDNFTFNTDNLIIDSDHKTASGSIIVTYKNIDHTFNLNEADVYPWSKGTDYVFVDYVIGNTNYTFDFDISPEYESSNYWTLYLSADIDY